jgi:hypothetical protein
MRYGYEEPSPRDLYDAIVDNLEALYDGLQESLDKEERRADILEQRVDSLLEETTTMSQAYQQQREATDTAYTQRAIAAIAFAHTVLALGGTAGVGQDDRQDQAEEWRVVLYVDTPAGQLSWHIAPADQPMLAGLPEYKGKWSGSSNSSNTEFYKSFIV